MHDPSADDNTGDARTNFESREHQAHGRPESLSKSREPEEVLGLAECPSKLSKHPKELKEIDVESNASDIIEPLVESPNLGMSQSPVPTDEKQISHSGEVEIKATPSSLIQRSPLAQQATPSGSGNGDKKKGGRKKRSVVFESLSSLYRLII